MSTVLYLFIARLKSALLNTLAMLADVGDESLFKYKDDIFPIAIECLQKDVEYLYPCLALLRNFVSCTEYVCDLSLFHSLDMSLFLITTTLNCSSSY